jgi:hypothetical protein
VKSTWQIQTFISAVVLAAVASASYAVFASHSLHLVNALAVLALAAPTSRMKVKLPRINGNMSVNLPFLLVAVVSLSALEAVAIACASTVVQCWPKRSAEFKPEQMLFNVSMMAFAASMGSLMGTSAWMGKAAWATEPLLLAMASATFFLSQTAPVAGIIKLTEGAAMQRVWMSIAQLSFPYYVVSACATSMVNVVSHHLGWQAALLLFPVMYGIHLSYRLYFDNGSDIPQPTPLSARAASVGK